ncbi:MAG: S8 family serine peptidase [Asgard group archaeon]|nr:S8 family serine peptidase [Asgard group archaeon]
MKNKFLTVFMIFCIASPGFLVLTISAKSLPTFFTASTLYSIEDEPYIPAMLEEDCLEWFFEQPDYVTDIPWWHDLIDKEDVPNNGAGVYVAVLDTGLMDSWPYYLPEANIRADLGKGFSHDIVWDDTIGDISIGPLRDDRGFITDLASGHGTHVTSTITGFNVFDVAYVEGIAPLVNIIPVLVLDAWLIDSPYGLLGFSGGTDEMISAGIYYIADLAADLDGPVIINMSLGGPTPTQMIEDAIDYAIDKGVIIVCSAVNEGEEGLGYPGGYDQVISCAAGGWTEMFYQEWGDDEHWFWDGVLADVPEKLNKPDVFGNEYQVYLEDFSSRPNYDLGQKASDLDFMLPGAWILGPYKPKFTYDVGLYWVSGTSMAAPHGSAIAALILEIFPYFEQSDIEWILKIAASGKRANEKRGFPQIGEDVLVAYWLPGYVYTANWDEDDFGQGFLKANNAMFTAFIYSIFYYFRKYCW